jgi:hypothetical protein
MNLPTKPGLYLVQFHQRRAALLCIDGKAPFLLVKKLVDAYDLRPLDFDLVGHKLYVGEHLMVFAKLVEIEKL